MPSIQARTGPIARAALAGSVVIGGFLAGRALLMRKVSASDKLAEALLGTEKLNEAAKALPDGTEQALAWCVAYTLEVDRKAANAVGSARAEYDAAGYSRTHTHPFTRASSTVLTEHPAYAGESTGDKPATGLSDQILTYSATVPECAEVRGTRRVGMLHMAGLSPAWPVVESVQISLKDGYTAQMETELEVAEYLMPMRPRVFGAVMLRDNRGNAGRVHVATDGGVSGTVTRGGRVVGRFEGRLAEGVQFKPYEIARSGE
jgi:hypothetical protein